MHNVSEAGFQQLLHGDSVSIVLLKFLQIWSQIALKQTGRDVLRHLELAAIKQHQLKVIS
jgi:hypothetical protein